MLTSMANNINYMKNYLGKLKKVTSWKILYYFRAYFCDNHDISDNTVLGDLVSSVGLNADEALSTFSDQKYIKEYEDGIQEAQRKGQ